MRAGVGSGQGYQRMNDTDVLIMSMFREAKSKEQRRKKLGRTDCMVGADSRIVVV